MWIKGKNFNTATLILFIIIFYQVQMKISNMKYEAALSNLKSLQFITAANKIESEVLAAIRSQLKSVVAVKVKSFSSDNNNNLVVNYIVVMNKNFTGDSNTTSEIANVITNAKYATLIPDPTYNITAGGQ